MDSQLYETILPNHKIFEDIKDSLNENTSGKLRNLMELKDDVLYLWNSIGNCLFSLNLRHLEDHKEDTPYQKLHLVSPPSFEVERVITSTYGSRACLWGSRGVVVAELPSRWGRSGLFESGSQTVLCKSFCLDERFLYSQAEVRRVHWHPTSLSHMLVLVSDNTIRLYNIALKNGPKFVQSFTIGPKPSGLLAGRTLLDSLGDTAVDFIPTPDSESLLILRGNGDVYMMECSLDTKSSLLSRVSGPLAMYPPADDNYGTDSCSITVLGGFDTPPLVVVATSSAALYHCLLLPNPSDKEDGKDSHALYVVEAVDLDIALYSNDQDLQYSYPVHLYPCAHNTYVCVHAGGAHAVSLPMLQHLRDLCRADESETESAISGVCGAGSVARHLAQSGAPPVGAARAPPPRAALLLLSDRAALCVRTLEPFDLEEQLYKEIQLKNPALEQDDINKLLKENQKMSFTSIMQEILTRDVSQPILNINKSEEPSPSECLEVLSSAVVRLRGEYCARQQRAQRAARRKLSALHALARQQGDWCSDLQKDIEDVQLQSVVLKEKCALAEKYQDDLKYRSSAVIRSVRAESAASPAERALLAELHQHARAAHRLADQLGALTLHAHRKSTELKRWQEDYKKKDIALGKSHSDTIQSILQEQTSQISTLIEETKLLKDQLGVV